MSPGWIIAICGIAIAVMLFGIAWLLWEGAR